jgi:hypothetical protein
MANDERMKILNMLAEGKISAEEAARLLDAVGEPEQAAAAGKGRMLRIMVYEGDMNTPKTRLSIPLSVARWATKFIPKNAQAKIDEHEIDLKEIEQLVETGEPQELIHVEEDDKRVIIKIE